MIAVARKQDPLTPAQHELINAHADLPARIAIRVIRQNPWLPESLIDFEGIANMALLEAVRGYKPERSAFLLFASVVIKRRIMDRACKTLRGCGRSRSPLLDMIEEPASDHSALFDALDTLPDNERQAVIGHFQLERDGHRRPSDERHRKEEERLIQAALPKLRLLLTPPPEADPA